MAATRRPLAQLLSSFTGHGSSYKTHVTAEWMQGRTTYGGCSAALCLEAARRLLGERSGSLPLRSAQVTFTGPAGGDVALDATILRDGKAMCFVRSEASSGGSVATTATFAFGAPRPSGFDEVDVPARTDLAPPERCEDFFAGVVAGRPTFTQNFEARLAAGGRPFSASAHSDHWLWVRHVGASDDGGVEGVAPAVALLALADMPPPAITARFGAPAPIASATWQVNLLHDAPVAGAGGWWLLRTRVEHARDGYSSQDMAVWGGGGAQPVLVGRQSVAIFDQKSVSKL